MTYGIADMHMHTTASDGAASVTELLDFVSNHRQLDVIAVTDHDRLDSSFWAYERRENYSFDIVPGMEVTSREGHVLAYWVTETVPANMSLEETVLAVHEQGGIAILAHPFHVHVAESLEGVKRYIHDIELIKRIGFDGVEAVNSAVVLPGANLYTKIACRSLGLAYVGNSDSHVLSSIGSGRTKFPGKTGEDYRQSILKQKTVALGGVWSPLDYYAYFKGVRNGSIQYVSLSDTLERQRLERRS